MNLSIHVEASNKNTTDQNMCDPTKAIIFTGKPTALNDVLLEMKNNLNQLAKTLKNSLEKKNKNQSE